ncbi:ATP-binding protein [Actinoplanes sp. DH11]|uniref:ATP-binding protein n=1 Tax=Actinoplanes sp. DH11 TaxID=2857011 RepID=UPI001E5A821F|nr:ATP-binding protein [Actinoplanes sp. DH11]
MSVQRRLNLGFIALFLLLMAFLVVQFGIGGRVDAEHERRAAEITAARLANLRVLQQMTDAETGLRGFQLTGDTAFLEPYESGRAGALAALDEVEAGVADDPARQVAAQERAVARTWFEEYAAPVVATGQAGEEEAHAVRGKQIFDELRLVNEAVDQSIAADQRAEHRAGTSATRRVTAASAGLLALIVLMGYAVVRTGRRQLLAPLDQLTGTIRRLAAGDRGARAEPVGSAELRTAVEALNDLAAQTDALLAEEHARVARAGLRQAVAAELQDLRDPPAAVHRIAELIGVALGAGTVHCVLTVPGTGAVRVAWPDGSAGLPAPVAGDLLTGGPGRVVMSGDDAIGVSFGGDADCDPGYLRVARPGTDGWAAAEQRLLTGVAEAIERVLRQLTLQYRQARLITELRMLDQRKDVFISTVTHELRTPLTSILGYTEMLTEDADEDLTPMQKRSLSAISRNAHRLHETIADLVLLDRPDVAGEGGSEPLDLGEVATTVHTELANAVRAKELTVSFDAAECWVMGDRIQLQRALRKLMENAIKFTPAGGSVRCVLTADAHTVTVAVTDTGIGIPAEDVPGLFTPFHRAGNAMDQAVQGPGLGLAIVRDIVSDHGGSIAVQSVVGRGSTFTLTLPAIAAPVPQQEPLAVG